MASVITIAQQDTVHNIKASNLRKTQKIQASKHATIILTDSQQQWLNKNYKKIAGLKKDSAASIVQKNVGDISEASLDFLINQAAKLQIKDNNKEIAKLSEILNSLKMQKRALQRTKDAKQSELNKTTDEEKRKTLTAEITELQRKIEQVEEAIRQNEVVIRKLRTSS